MIQNYINNNLNNILIEHYELDNYEELLLNSFSSHTELDNVIEFSKYYEEFVIKNFNDPNQRKYLLSTISAYKWIGFNIFYRNSEARTAQDFKPLTQNKSITCTRRTGIELCMCKRIQAREDGWNWVDTVGFLISGPEQLACDLATCTAEAIEESLNDDNTQD